MSDRTSVDRRSFLRTTGASTIGLASLAALRSGPLVGKTAAATQSKDNPDNKKDKPSKGNIQILIAAEIAEALAVTTYTSIINFAPFFARLPGDDQGYLEAARQEEMSHYLLEQSVTRQPSPFSIFYYPPGMFESAQTTLNVL